jgi:heme O synthase-like polyprenyltransferase
VCVGLVALISWETASIVFALVSALLMATAAVRVDGLTKRRLDQSMPWHEDTKTLETALLRQKSLIVSGLGLLLLSIAFHFLALLPFVAF